MALKNGSCVVGSTMVKTPIFEGSKIVDVKEIPIKSVKAQSHMDESDGTVFNKHAPEDVTPLFRYYAPELHPEISTDWQRHIVYPKFSYLFPPSINDFPLLKLRFKIFPGVTEHIKEAEQVEDVKEEACITTDFWHAFLNEENRLVTALNLDVGKAYKAQRYVKKDGEYKIGVAHAILEEKPKLIARENVYSLLVEGQSIFSSELSANVLGMQSSIDKAYQAVLNAIEDSNKASEELANECYIAEVKAKKTFFENLENLQRMSESVSAERLPDIYHFFDTEGLITGDYKIQENHEKDLAAGFPVDINGKF